MKTKIPDISKQIDKEELLIILQNEYSVLGPLWVNSQIEWLNSIYISFKNHDKFLIVIYLIKKTLNFYSRNFVKLSYDEFYEKDTVEIEKFSISEISNNLNIPKESARRKIIELENLGVIKKKINKTIIDRSAFTHVKPVKTIKRIARFLSILSSFCSDKKILEKKINSEDLVIMIKKNFTQIWIAYYDLQIPMMLSYKKIFSDLETFHIFGTCVVNAHYSTMKFNKNIMHRDIFIESLLSNNKKGLGINAMSISDITNIPRATVIRKLQKLVKLKILTIDEKKHYRLSGFFAKTLKPTQSIVLEQLSNFSSKVFNQVIANESNPNLHL